VEKTRQWTILTAVGTLAIIAAGWFLVASPQHKHAKDLRAQATNMDASNAQLQSQVQVRRNEQSGVAVEQRKLDKIAQQIPDNPALPTLIRQLSAAAQAAGVDLVSLSPSAPAAATGGAAAAPTSATASAGTLLQIPVSLQVTGSYFNVEAFFNAVEKMTRVMKVPSWTMAPFSGPAGTDASTSGSSGASTQSLPGSVTTTISGLLYEMPVVAVAPAVTPTAPAKTTGTSSQPSSTSTGSTSTGSTTSSSTSSNGQ
jgi:Tfp pilus assembly protein PilO